MTPASSAELDDTWSSNTEARPRTNFQSPSKRRRTESYGSASQPEIRELGLMRDGGEPGTPRFIGSGSGIHFIRQVYDVLARRTNATLTRTWSRESGNLVPGEDDQLVSHTPGQVATTPGARASLWHQDEIIDDSDDGCPGVNFDALVDWTRNYFENWHPAFPFLHGPEVLELLEQVGTQGIASLSNAEAAVVRAVVSISLADTRQLNKRHGPIPNRLVFLTLDEIASSLQFVMGSPASLRNIQAAVCVELFLVSMLRFNMASRLGGAIVRMAFHLGLHRCPYRYPNFNRHEADMRKRVWWSIYCIERMVCQSLGLPLDIRDDDVDVCYPTEEMHHRVRNKAPDDASTGNTDQLQFLTLLSKQARIRGMILELRNKNLDFRQDTVEHAFLVQGQLSKWANEVLDVSESGLNYDSETSGLNEGQGLGEDSPLPPSRRILLEIMQHESTITLNRPLLASKQETPASQAAFQACIGASRAIIDALDKPSSQTRPHHDIPSLNSVILWPLMTWSVWMSCFVLTYAALEGVTTVSTAHRFATRALRILKKLAFRGTAWPDSCAHAVEHLVSALTDNRNNANNLYTERRSTLKSRAMNGQFPANLDQPSVNIASSGRSTEARVGTRLFSTTTGDATSNAGLNGAHSSFYFDQIYRKTQEPSQNGLLHSNNAQNGLSPTNLDAPPLTDDQLALPENVAVRDMPVQDWMDPLNVLDFSNFAQTGSSDSTMGFGFY